MSRQQEWQRRKLAAGLCFNCGQRNLIDKYRCKPCADRQRERDRDRYHKKKGNM